MNIRLTSMTSVEKKGWKNMWRVTSLKAIGLYMEISIIAVPPPQPLTQVYWLSMQSGSASFQDISPGDHSTPIVSVPMSSQRPPRPPPSAGSAPRNTFSGFLANKGGNAPIPPSLQAKMTAVRLLISHSFPSLVHPKFSWLCLTLPTS